MTVIVDASLATKWFIPEHDSDLAVQFFDRWYGRMHVPDLFFTEVGNALVRLANQREATAEEAIAGLDRLGALVSEALQVHRLSIPMVVDAGRLAIGIGHPIKDCHYLILADALGVPLATCDVKFHDRVGDPARVRLLADLV